MFFTTMAEPLTCVTLSYNVFAVKCSRIFLNSMALYNMITDLFVYKNYVGKWHTL